MKIPLLLNKVTSPLEGSSTSVAVKFSPSTSKSFARTVAKDVEDKPVISSPVRTLLYTIRSSIEPLNHLYRGYMYT